MGKHNKLVAVMTCQQNLAKAQAQRETWVRDIVEQGSADVRFFVGGPLRMIGPDVVWLSGVDDTYCGIPEKVRAICRYAVDHRFDYVMKCDDDVYIAPQRFPWLPLGADYVGRFRSPYGNYPAHFASGFAYWLSAAAAQIVGWGPDNGDWMDERYVANRLALNGIFGYNDPVNYLVSGPHLGGHDLSNRPILRSGTVFCEYRANQMQELHQVLRHAAPVAGHPGLREMPRVIITEEQAAAAPCDRIPERKLERYTRFQNGTLT